MSTDLHMLKQKSHHIMKEFRSELKTKRTYYLLYATAGLTWSTAIFMAYAAMAIDFWTINTYTIIIWSGLFQAVLSYFSYRHWGMIFALKGVGLAFMVAFIIIGGVLILPF